MLTPDTRVDQQAVWQFMVQMGLNCCVLPDLAETHAKLLPVRDSGRIALRSPMVAERVCGVTTG